MIDFEEIKDKIEASKIAIATCDKNCNPHNIIIMYAKVKDDKIIITDNYMQKTKENLKINPKISLVFWDGKEGWKINGTAEYLDSGKWIDFIRGLKENKGFPCKGAIVIEINNMKKA